jgi:hypothetical protein
MKRLILGKPGWVLGCVGLGALMAAELVEALRGMVFEGRRLDGRRRDTGRY